MADFGPGCVQPEGASVTCSSRWLDEARLKQMLTWTRPGEQWDAGTGGITVGTTRTAGRPAILNKSRVLDGRLPLPFNGWSGLVIEMNVRRNNTIDQQDNFLKALQASDY